MISLNIARIVLKDYKSLIHLPLNLWFLLYPQKNWYPRILSTCKCPYLLYSQQPMRKIPNANDMIEIVTATGTDTITTDAEIIQS